MNAYRARVADHPGRIFGRLGEAAEREELSSLIAGAKERFVELGSGSGLHLIEQARRNPAAALFGFELRFKRAVRTVEKAERAAVENLYILRCHTQFFGEIFPERSLSGVWVNFPDPWEKRKKNRMLNPGSLQQIHNALKPGGFLSFKTDHEEMFDSIHGQLVNGGAFQLKKVIRGLHDCPEETDKNVITEFESLFRSQGLPVYLLSAIRGVDH